MYNITNNKSLSNFSCKCELQRQKGSMDRQNQGKPLWSRVSLGRAMMPWRHYTDFIGAHSPFSTVCKWAQRGLIKWVCGFLLKSRGPLHPTPVRKQIKLQFHHLEGAVSCPNATLAPPLSTYTHKTLHLCLNRAPPPPKCQRLSTAQLPRGMEGFEGRKRERGGWVVVQAKGIGSMHGDLIPASSQWNILLWRKWGKEWDRKAILLWP